MNVLSTVNSWILFLFFPTTFLYAINAKLAAGLCFTRTKQTNKQTNKQNKTKTKRYKWPWTLSSMLIRMYVNNYHHTLYSDFNKTITNAYVLFSVSTSSPLPVLSADIVHRRVQRILQKSSGLRRDRSERLVQICWSSSWQGCKREIRLLRSVRFTSRTVASDRLRDCGLFGKTHHLFFRFVPAERVTLHEADIRNVSCFAHNVVFSLLLLLCVWLCACTHF